MVLLILLPRGVAAFTARLVARPSLVLRYHGVEDLRGAPRRSRRAPRARPPVARLGRAGRRGPRRTTTRPLRPGTLRPGSCRAPRSRASAAPAPRSHPAYRYMRTEAATAWSAIKARRFRTGNRTPRPERGGQSSPSVSVARCSRVNAGTASIQQPMNGPSVISVGRIAPERARRSWARVRRTAVDGRRGPAGTPSCRARWTAVPAAAQQAEQASLTSPDT